jgi:isoleucyl-tRNA synthetase
MDYNDFFSKEPEGKKEKLIEQCKTIEPLFKDMANVFSKVKAARWQKNGLKGLIAKTVSTAFYAKLEAEKEEQEKNLIKQEIKTLKYNLKTIQNPKNKPHIIKKRYESLKRLYKKSKSTELKNRIGPLIQVLENPLNTSTHEIETKIQEANISGFKNKREPEDIRVSFINMPDLTTPDEFIQLDFTFENFRKFADEIKTLAGFYHKYIADDNIDSKNYKKYFKELLFYLLEEETEDATRKSIKRTIKGLKEKKLNL